MVILCSSVHRVTWSVIIVLPLALAGFNIIEVQATASSIQVIASSTATSASCPTCSTMSTRRHGWYIRHPQDLPSDGKSVTLCLKVRRFLCVNSSCPQRTFVERLADWLPAYAQFTLRLNTLIRQIGTEVGGEAGRRILRYFNLAVSGDTVLRRVRETDATDRTTPRVVGIDDWAIKKGRTYGTIIVDLEAHRVVDLLPDRTASTLEQWLQLHPGIEIAARDRSTEYAAGIQAGCPLATQVADRWHLLVNLRQVAERVLMPIYPQLEPLSIPPEQAHLFSQLRAPFPRAATDHRRVAVSRERNLEQYEHIQELRQKGFSIRQIARLLKLHRATVTKYYSAETFPERKPVGRAKSMLDPYVSYLDERRRAGCENAMQLWREIREQGYPGTYRQVQRWLHQRRTQPSPHMPKARSLQQVSGQRPLWSSLPALTQLSWLLVKDPKTLSQPETIILHHVQGHPDIAHVYELVQHFATIVREQRATELDVWLERATNSHLKPLVNFATTLQQDWPAILAAVSLSWSNGQTEGQVNRLKFIKRQMYGRAHFDLLRLRVLHSINST